MLSCSTSPAACSVWCTFSCRLTYCILPLRRIAETLPTLQCAVLGLETAHGVLTAQLQHSARALQCSMRGKPPPLAAG